MWKTGIVILKGAAFWYQAKVYDEPSEFGIDNGRISKLAIRAGSNKGKELFNYDRGNDFDELPSGVLVKVLRRYK